jgi:mono/diheme cytochrome c family protein
MTTNAALRLPTARNQLMAIDEGLPEHAFPNGAHMQAMPGFRDLLSDQETVDLANYLRVTWGGGRPDVDAKFASGIRAANP